MGEDLCGTENVLGEFWGDNDPVFFHVVCQSLRPPKHPISQAAISIRT